MLCPNCLNFNTRADAKYCVRCGWRLVTVLHEAPSRQELTAFERRLVAALTNLREIQNRLEQNHAHGAKRQAGAVSDRLSKQLLLLSRVESELRVSLCQTRESLESNQQQRPASRPIDARS